MVAEKQVWAGLGKGPEFSGPVSRLNFESGPGSKLYFSPGWKPRKFPGWSPVPLPSPGCEAASFYPQKIRVQIYRISYTKSSTDKFLLHSNIPCEISRISFREKLVIDGGKGSFCYFPRRAAFLKGGMPFFNLGLGKFCFWSQISQLFFWHFCLTTTHFNLYFFFRNDISFKILLTFYGLTQVIEIM